MTVAIDQEQLVLSAHEIFNLAYGFLVKHGLGEAQAQALAAILCKAQRDGCISHGLQRLPGTLDTMAHPAFNAAADPQPVELTPVITRIDAEYGFSILAVERALPVLIRQAKQLGIAMLAVNNGFHSTALWPVVEEIAQHGLVGLSMNPTHDWMAPAGGTRGALGTNPLAFAWPRPDNFPYVFDFATSAASRADIALYRQQGCALPAGWGLDQHGQPSTDAASVLAGAMLPFGGHKGSALATMIELLAGSLIGDKTSKQSAEFDQNASAAPCHGELIVAFNPSLMADQSAQDGAQYCNSEDLFARITSQGARLPGERRYQARAQAAQNGITLSKQLYDRIIALTAGDLSEAADKK